MPEYWTILANDVLHVRPIRALGIYASREAADLHITDEQRHTGWYAAPLTTGFDVPAGYGRE
jgi:hypothetical protein